MKIILLALLLAGCAAAPAPVTQEVKLPVYVSCVTAVPARPDYEFGKLTLTATDGEKVLAMARDWPRGREYEGELQAVIDGCRVP
jgi:starvation-inducible outer membrane lipoprotein